jgi:uracil-DNA glycosylase
MPDPNKKIPMLDLLADIRACRHCEDSLPLGPRPVVRAHEASRILLVGQAPGTKVHASGVPWDDPSGKRLRQWLEVDAEQFYDEKIFAIVPMGFCYPGKGKSGDLPPSTACAPLWHEPLLSRMPNIELTLLIGGYAQKRYLGDTGQTLTERVQGFADTREGVFPLPHPSPRNTFWLRRNPWFETDVLPQLRAQVQAILYP